jgi:hypothetical protein
MNQRFFHDFHPIPLDDMKRGPLLKTVLPAPPPRWYRSNAAPDTGADVIPFVPEPPPQIGRPSRYGTRRIWIRRSGAPLRGGA